MVIFYSLLTVVLLSPLPYGSNRAWAWSLCALLIAMLGIAWAIDYLMRRNKRGVFFNHTKAIIDMMIAFFLVIIWATLQITPNVFPALNHPIWQLQNELLNQTSGFMSLSLTETPIFIMRYMSYGIVFWLSLCYCQQVNNARKVMMAFSLAGVIYAIYGLMITLGHIHLTFWQKIPSLNAVSSTFINRNHFATFAGLTLLCSSALLHDSIAISAKYYRGSNMGLQLFIENLITRAYLPLIAFMVISTALVLTHSRGGFLSSLLALMVLMLTLNIHKKSRSKIMLGFFISFIIIGSSIFYISSAGLIEKMNSQGLADPQRVELYKQVWQAILTNPYCGFGLGSFSQTFTMYKSLSIAGVIEEPMLWDYAHNTYLELIFELGFPAALLMFYCFFKMVFLCLKGLIVRRRDWLYSAVGLSATVLVATHATVDFSLQIPAIAYSYFLLMGCAIAQSFSSIKTI